MSFARLALTQSANLLGLTPAIVGFALARSLGVGPAVGSMLLACAVTCLLACGSACLAVAYRAPTAPLSGHLLGPVGPRLVGAALAVALCGWFGVHMIALRQAVPVLLAQGAPPVPHLPLVVGCAALSLAIVWRGNSRIAGINSIQAPLLMLAVAWAAWDHVGALRPAALWPALGFDLPSVAMVVAAGLGDVVDMPAVLHRAHSRRAAMGAAIFSYGLVLPTLLVLGALLSDVPQASTALAAMARGSDGWRYAVCGLAIGSACLGNAGILYSGGLSLAAACGARPALVWRTAMAAGAAALASTRLSTHLPQLLDWLAIATGAVGASLLCHFALDGGRALAHTPARRQRYSAAATAAAAALGLVTFLFCDVSAPGVGVGVAFLSSAAAALCVRLMLWTRTRRPG